MPHAQLRPHLSLVADPAELLRILPRYARGDDVNEPMFDLGIPYPIWPTKPSPAEASARTATRQGRQVNSIIARLAHLAPHADDDLIIEATVTAVVTGRENGNLPRARARVSSLVRQYLRMFLPYAATLTGTEVATGKGRADLLWSHLRAGTFYDEVKTGRSPSRSPTRRSTRSPGTPTRAGQRSRTRSRASASSPSGTSPRPCGSARTRPSRRCASLRSPRTPLPEGASRDHPPS